MTTSRRSTIAAETRIGLARFILLLPLLLCLVAACGNGGTGGPRY